MLSNKYLSNKFLSNKIKVLFNIYAFLGAITLSMKNIELSLIGPFVDDNNLCLVNNAITHTILKDLKYISCSKKQTINVNTIYGSAKLIEGFGIAHIIFPRGIKFVIDDALYSERSQRNLLSFKDISKNGYHIETTNKGNVEYLCITSIVSGKKSGLGKLHAFSSGLYYTNIDNIKADAIVNQSQ